MQEWKLGRLILHPFVKPEEDKVEALFGKQYATVSSALLHIISRE